MNKLSKYGEPSRILGKGTYGTVYLYTNDENEKEYAIKRMTRDSYDGTLSVDILNDIGTLTYLDHPNIVKIVDVIITEDYVYLVLNLAQSDLLHKIKDDSIDSKDIPSLIYPLFDAMAYYFNMNILHLDIKPSNILFYENNIPKLTDFGLAHQGYCSVYPQSMSTNVVTLYYRSINILLGEDIYDSMIDIWAMGCILYEMYTGNPPFMGYDETKMIESIFSVLGTPTEDIWPGVTELSSGDIIFKFKVEEPRGFTNDKITSNPDLLDLLYKIFNYSNFADNRNSNHISKILTHPYFNEINNGLVDYTRLTCLQSLYLYDSRIELYKYINYNHRIASLEFIASIAKKYYMRNSAIFLSYLIFDRYTAIKNIDINNIQAILIMSSSLSSKIADVLDINYREIANLIGVSSSGLTEYIEIENDIVTTLEWKIYLPSSYDFLNVNLWSYNYEDRYYATVILYILYIYCNISGFMVSHIADIAMNALLVYKNQEESINIDKSEFSIFKNIGTPISRIESKTSEWMRHRRYKFNFNTFFKKIQSL